MLDRVAGADWVRRDRQSCTRRAALVVACRTLSEAQYATFAAELHKARLNKSARHAAVRSAFEMLEEGMSVLCVTAVEDRLQAHVRTTLEMLRNANVRTWMLTGDKLETAKIVAQNSSLVARHQAFYAVSVRTAAEARQQLNGYPQGSVNAPCLILDGPSLDLCVDNHTRLFIEVACAAPTVVVCRCSPTQKAAIVKLLRQHTNKCTAAIGDGGNDVGMIHAAHVGISIVGREGRQAALAADFSVSQFSSCTAGTLARAELLPALSNALAVCDPPRVDHLFHPAGVLLSVLLSTDSALLGSARAGLRDHLHDRPSLLSGS